MTSHEADFTFRARYFKLGDIHQDTRQVWFVLHGYGQLAQFFLNKFNILNEHAICVIAPEGLSRFYLEELQPSGHKNNRVGATWMTRENREMDIRNYIQYLNTIYSQELKDRKIPVTVLGFSQGSATATRWVMNEQINFDRLILWSGIFPPDMNFEQGSKRLQNKEVFLVYGSKDPFLTDARFSEMKTLTKKLKTNVKEIVFDGEHEIDNKTLEKFL